MNSSRVRIFLCCVPAIFANSCSPNAPCAGLCEPGEVCVNGACVECENDADCDPNENCVNGTCENVSACCDALSGCMPKTCILPNFCVDGVCVNCEITADCDGNGNCPNGSCLCLNGSCVPCDDNNACTRDTRVVDEQTVEFVCSYVPIPCAFVTDCPPGCNVACLNNFCFAPP